MMIRCGVGDYGLGYGWNSGKRPKENGLGSLLGTNGVS
jgi:hypothetical protein